jgi:hypothetical protein
VASLAKERIEWEESYKKKLQDIQKENTQVTCLYGDCIGDSIDQDCRRSTGDCTVSRQGPDCIGDCIGDSVAIQCY